MNLALIILLYFISISYSNLLMTIISPKQLSNKLPQVIYPHLSPIGFRPLSGYLTGLVIPANPFNACSSIKDVTKYGDDIFIMADDNGCLQSIKAKNIATSGAFVGLIKQNINNTLHDKQINLVHIPIIELDFNIFNTISEYSLNSSQSIIMQIDFSYQIQHDQITLQVWFSPTQSKSYQFLLQMKDFIQKQSKIYFQPHYVLMSQKDSKTYLGCLSSGKYCPTQLQYQGKYQGQYIVKQSLRQLVIWKIYNNNSEKWWKYIQYFYKNCLRDNQYLFTNFTKYQHCALDSQLMAGINPIQKQQMGFTGDRQLIDDNIYLRQERQLYLRQQIQSHPIVMLNKKQLQLNSTFVQQRICKQQGNEKSQLCLKTAKMPTSHLFGIMLGIIIVFVLIAIVYRVYMHVRMRRQIKSEVDKTLQQYYRYIQTFEQSNGQNKQPKKTKKKQKAIQLNQQMQQIQDNATKNSQQMKQVNQ